MCTVSVYELRTNLSKYLKSLNTEEEIIITNNGKVVAKLVPFSQPEGGIIFGTGKKYLKGRDPGDPFYGDEEIANLFMEAIKWF